MSTFPLATIGAALLPAVLVDLALARFGARRMLRVVLALALFIVMLVPIAGLSGAQRLRGLLGDLSVTSIALMVCWFVAQSVPAVAARLRIEGPPLAALLLAVACVFYPLALGLSPIDPYAHGYYPSALSAMLLALFACAVLAWWNLSALLIALAAAGFAAHVLESDNLWDYLFDVPLVVAAIVAVVLKAGALARLPWSQLFPRRFTIGALAVVASFLLVAVVLSRVNPQHFDEVFTGEDLFVEWVTSLSLFSAFVYSVYRFFTARRRFGVMGQLVLIFIAFVCIFGAGEEISWGQRIFGIETPAGLAERNAQGEMNLHNLTFEWNGKTVKINRLVFGRGLTLALVVYLLVISPLYRRPGFVRRIVDRWAIPIPTAVQTVAYLVVVLVVETLIDSPKRGEMTEFGGAIVFLLNIVFPFNRALYRDDDAPGPTSLARALTSASPGPRPPVLARSVPQPPGSAPPVSAPVAPGPRAPASSRASKPPDSPNTSMR